jgi:hypothetical protein
LIFEGLQSFGWSVWLGPGKRVTIAGACATIRAKRSMDIDTVSAADYLDGENHLTEQPLQEAAQTTSWDGKSWDC